MVLLIISIVVVGVCVCVCVCGGGGGGGGGVRVWGGIIGGSRFRSQWGQKNVHIYICLSKKNIDVPYLVFSVYQLQLKSISNHTSSL